MSEKGSDHEKVIIWHSAYVGAVHEVGYFPAESHHDEEPDDLDSADGLNLSISSPSFSASEFTSDSVSGSDYMPITGDDKNDAGKSMRERRQILREVNRHLRRNVLASLKVDIAAASAKLFVTLKILSRLFHTSQDALRSLETGKRNLSRIEDTSKSLSRLGGQVLPNWKC